jgi:hypothetical protein
MMNSSPFGTMAISGTVMTWILRVRPL